MAGWQARRGAGLALRIVGAVLIAAAWAALRTLIASPTMRGAAAPGAGDFALAACAFLGASGGIVLALLGTHIFDRVDLPARWARLEIAAHDRHAERLRDALDAPRDDRRRL